MLQDNCYFLKSVAIERASTPVPLLLRKRSGERSSRGYEAFKEGLSDDKHKGSVRGMVHVPEDIISGHFVASTTFGEVLNKLDEEETQPPYPLKKRISRAYQDNSITRCVEVLKQLDLEENDPPLPPKKRILKSYMSAVSKEN